MILNTVKIVLAGIERTVPAALLKQYESFGWKVQGANPAAAQRQKQKKEKKNA